MKNSKKKLETPIEVVGAYDYHIPVLLEASIEALNIKQDGIYADLTLGGAGHSRAILEKLGEKGRLFGFDQDAVALANAPQDERFTLVAANFRYLSRFMDYYGIDHLDGILADLGVSSQHFDSEERGFSFRSDAPLLDMRMNQLAKKSAIEVLNEYNEEQLANVLYKYGELKQSRRLAASIAKARTETEGGLQRVGQLLEAVKRLVPAHEEKKQLARIFQALRIEVNDELGALDAMLHSATDLLAPGGRLVVIAYHSLEDRMVKNYLRYGSTDTPNSAELEIYGMPQLDWRTLSRKAIAPSEEELAKNPRSRSAKLRVAEKK